jgi:hypothetical protein
MDKNDNLCAHIFLLRPQPLLPKAGQILTNKPSMFKKLSENFKLKFRLTKLKKLFHFITEIKLSKIGTQLINYKHILKVKIEVFTKFILELNFRLTQPKETLSDI